MAKVSVAEQAWLAGLFDGEGCVYYHANKESFLLRIRCGIGMTCFNTMDRVSQLLDQEGIAYQWGEQQTLKGKIVHVIHIARFEMVTKFCDLVLPYSITKKSDLEAARLAVEIIERAGPFPRGHRSEARSVAHASALSHLREEIPPRYRRR